MQKEILQAIAESLGLSPADLDRDTSFSEDLNLGPLEFNDLISQLSERFDVVLDPEELANVKNVEGLIILIEDNLI